MRGRHLATSVLLGLASGCTGTVTPAPLATPGGGPPALPASVPVAMGVEALTAGSGHTCALLDDGRVACWGARWPGSDIHALRKRVGDRVRWSEPAPANGIDDAVAIDAEGARTCAVGARGRVLCWSELEASPWRGPPEEVAGLDDAVGVAVGDDHTCARRRGGTVVCWGTGAQPAEVAGLTAVEELSSGPRHTCARASGGKIWCWGDGSRGQLGGPAQSTRPVELPVGDATGIAAGTTMTCASRAGGKVSCWGERWIGNPHGKASELVAPGEAWDVSDARQVAAGGAWACALNQADRLHCWSWGGEGDGMLAFQAVNAEIDARSVALGVAHGCALRTDGAVVCWGANALGQLGDGANHDGTRPVAVQGVDDARSVRAGRRFTCALHRDGGVSCWGWNAGHELGDDTRTSRALPARVAGLAGVRSLAAGEGTSCAVLTGGGARCWGDNQLGVLGDGTDTQRTTVVAVQGVSDAVAIDVTSGHLGVVRGNGDVVGWGRHEDLVAGATVARVPGASVLAVNQWGYACALAGQRVSCWGAAHPGGSGRTWRPSDVGIEAIDLSSWDAVACAATPEGAVTCWSDGSDNWAKVPSTPTQRTDVKGATAVAVGGAHACALLAGGSVQCWGENGSGQLGGGSYEPSEDAVRVVGLDDAAAIDAGEDHTCAVRRDGGIVCWGGNEQGQLGDGRTGGPPPWLARTPIVVEGLGRLGGSKAATR